MFQLSLPPRRTPTIQAFPRDSSTAISPIVTGTVVAGRDTLYDFDISAWPDGDYVVDLRNPWGRFMLRKAGDEYLVADEWYELDSLAISCLDPSKVLVDDAFMGPGSMIYSINGVPVCDATIEVFLLSTYNDGKRDGPYRLGNSRQTSSGRWAIGIYLDPEIYVFRFYKPGVAGPDHYRVNVSFDPNQRTVEPLDGSQQGLAMLGIQLKKQEPLALRLPPPTPAPEPKPRPVPRVEYSPVQIQPVLAQPPENPLVNKPEKVKMPEVAVNHNHTGPKKLIYSIGGKPVDGASLQIFRASDYNAGNRTPDKIIGSAQQRADGTWSRPVMLEPGNYVLHCFKRGVAGPDSFNFTVEFDSNRS